MNPQGLNQPFHVIGENIHTTRVVLREGKLVTTAPDGRESVRYVTSAGETRYLPIFEELKSRQDYAEGKVKHVMSAVRTGMAGEQPDAQEALTYLRYLVERQVRTGADFLDLNVDELSWNRSEQVAAMEWLVRAVEPISSVPLSIDSSSLEILMAGIEACRGTAGKPMLNSASLERIEALYAAGRLELPVVVTAAGESGMPSDAEQRVENATRMIEAALAKGIPLERLYVDTLVFPVAVDSAFVGHCLEAFRCLRQRYGKGLHLTGGLSNVSFGIPCRKLINVVFINLAVEAGADSGIVDPVATDLNRVFLADKSAPAYRLAEDALLGRDPGCVEYMTAYREGELTDAI
ncbi:MAG TPA: dihydropteroate synthase [Bryobacteraceae bacterium]|nr:dihydropteroate synthase [Bryobacteraceae bacterium]